LAPLFDRDFSCHDFSNGIAVPFRVQFFERDYPHFWVLPYVAGDFYQDFEIPKSLEHTGRNADIVFSVVALVCIAFGGVHYYPMVNFIARVQQTNRGSAVPVIFAAVLSDFSDEPPMFFQVEHAD